MDARPDIYTKSQCIHMVVHDKGCRSWTRARTYIPNPNASTWLSMKRDVVHGHARAWTHKPNPNASMWLSMSSGAVRRMPAWLITGDMHLLQSMEFAGARGPARTSITTAFRCEQGKGSEMTSPVGYPPQRPRHATQVHCLTTAMANHR